MPRNIQRAFQWILLLIIALPARGVCGNSQYADALFATPTIQELDAAYALKQYTPECEDFVVGDVLDSGGWYQARKVTYTSDGTTQTGLFALPAGDGPFPLVMLNHAGFGGVTNFDLVRVRELTERGYAVAAATYRGEDGLAGHAAGDEDVLGDEAHDILNLLECAAAQPRVDGTRVAMLGASHGSGITLSALSILPPGRVRAAALLAIPSNLLGPGVKNLALEWMRQPSRVEALLQMLLTPDAMAKMKTVLGVRDRNPANIPETRLELLRRSPVFFADHIATPALLYYGAEDPIAFEEDGYAIAASLQARGFEARVTVYEGQGHAIGAENAAAAFNEIYEFFDKYLKP